MGHRREGRVPTVPRQRELGTLSAARICLQVDERDPSLQGAGAKDEEEGSEH